jgi:hypothetical protein
MDGYDVLLGKVEVRRSNHRGDAPIDRVNNSKMLSYQICETDGQKQAKRSRTKAMILVGVNKAPLLLRCDFTTPLTRQPTTRDDFLCINLQIQLRAKIFRNIR